MIKKRQPTIETNETLPTQQLPEANLREAESDFLKQIAEIRESIERVGIRQDELKGYVFEVTDSIKNLKSILAGLPKDAAKTKVDIHLTIQKNYDLISKFYENISSFESVRNRYQQDIGRLTKEKIYFLNVEIRKIEQKTDSSTGSVLKFMKELRSMIATVNNNPEISSRVLGSIEGRPEYDMS